MDEDAFETVAITWSQPEAAVMVSMFAFYDIPAVAIGQRHASVEPTLLTGLQGIAVRVPHAAVEEALALLADVAERPAAVRPYAGGTRWVYGTLVALMLLAPVVAILAGSEELAVLAGMPLMLLFAVAPPPRVASTLMLWKRRGRPGE